MSRKIFRSILAVAGVVLLASVLLIMGILYDYFRGVQDGQLTDGLDIASIAVEEDGTHYLEKIDTDRYRLTWIAADGEVIFDTQTGAEGMENHGGRAEVKDALQSGTGRSVRYSATLTEKTIYCAKRLTDGTVLRISASYASVASLALGMLQPILIVLFTALILSAVLSHRLAKRIVEPLNELNLEQPLENDTYPELAPLLERINRQHREITAQLKMLRQKTDEFAQITGAMSEGLVLLDTNGTVLSINPAAQTLFSVDGGAVGRDFLTIDRNRDLSLAIQKALTDAHSEVRIERSGREYRLDISRIESGGTCLGAVILSFDITEQEFAERNRREFTANVSHELKTPLQGIIGSADLIAAGMVKPEDMPRFVGHIRKEASRLIALIEDIIRLSQLDEGGELPCEEVDLTAVAEEVCANLRDAAAAKDVGITLDGSGATVHGVRRLLYEVIYNLCDNAIKYNLDGGSVTVTVEREANEAVVTVRDTGIGIAPEHQSRVFERFYRVDKSHSKASGGTGLGLSIVKHAVQYHHGRIELESTLGEGTSVRVCLPLSNDAK